MIQVKSLVNGTMMEVYEKYHKGLAVNDCL